MEATQGMEAQPPTGVTPAITLERKAALRALSTVEAATGRLSSKPLSAFVIAEGSRDRLEFKAYSQDSGWEYTMGMAASVDLPLDGTPFAIRPADLLKVLRASRANRVTITPADSRVAARAGALRMSLPSVECGLIEAHKRAIGPVLGSVTAPAPALRECLRQMRAFAHTNHTRVNLKGVNFAPREGLTRVAALDGHRILIQDTDWPCTVSKAASKGDKDYQSVTFPRDAIAPALKALDGNEDWAAQLEWGRVPGVNYGWARISTPRFALTAFSNWGAFPSFESVIPKENPNRLRVLKEPLMEALRACMACSQYRFAAVRLSFTPGTAVPVTADTERYEGMQMEAEIPALELVCAAPTYIGFDARLVVDALRALPGKEVVLDFSGPINPALFRSDDPAATGLQAVVMPLRIEW